MTKSELRNYIKRQLGSPYIKVELSDDHLDDSIDDSIAMFRKWAIGTATQETFFTKVISAGERHYSLPDGVTEVIDMNDTTDNLSEANQLFTTSNYMLNAGMLNFLKSGKSYSLVSYHLGLDYLDLLNKYSVSEFQWKYHKYNNTLTLSPLPSATDSWDNTSTNFMLIRSYMKEGFDIDGTDEESESLQSMYNDSWIKEYSTALSKIKLGAVRRKYASGNVLGNSSIQLDGAELIQEGKEEKKELEEDLKLSEVGDGWGLILG